MMVLGFSKGEALLERSESRGRCFLILGPLTWRYQEYCRVSLPAAFHVGLAMLLYCSKADDIVEVVSFQRTEESDYRQNQNESLSSHISVSCVISIMSINVRVIQRTNERTTELNWIIQSKVHISTSVVD